MKGLQRELSSIPPSVIQKNGNLDTWVTTSEPATNLMQIQKHGAPQQTVHQCATEHWYAEAIRGNKTPIHYREIQDLLHISTVALSGKEITHLQACICHKFAYFTVPTFSNLHAPHHQPNQLSPLWCNFLIHIALVRLFQLWIYSYNKRTVKMKYTSRQKTQGGQTQNSPLCEYDGKNHQVHWLAIPHL